VLLGRAHESAVIDQLLLNARSGGSGAIVIKGEAGIGKSALLGYAAHLASDMRVLRISGVESEAEIAFGALHLLLHEELWHIESLPDVQAAALRAALGEGAGQGRGSAAGRPWQTRSSPFWISFLWLATLTLLDLPP